MSTPVSPGAGYCSVTSVTSVTMTALQQGLLHFGLVLVATVAIVVLVVTGNLTTAAAGIVLALTGFGNIGVAGLPTNPPSSSTTTTSRGTSPSAAPPSIT